MLPNSETGNRAHIKNLETFREGKAGYREHTPPRRSRGVLVPRRSRPSRVRYRQPREPVEERTPRKAEF
jgi:hypothetical protein